MRSHGWLARCLTAAGLLLPAMAAAAQSIVNMNAAPSVNAPLVTVTSGVPRVVGTAADHALPGLRDGQVIDLPALPAAGAARVEVRVLLPDVGMATLILKPIQVIAPDCVVRLQKAGGVWEMSAAGPEKTYTGVVDGLAGSQVAASLLDAGLLAAVWLPDGSTRWIQPLTDFAPGAAKGLHVVYRGTDTQCVETCATPDGAAGSNSTPVGESPAPRGPGGPLFARIGFDADFEYFQAHSSSTSVVQDRIAGIVNVTNHQFLRETGLVHFITFFVIRQAEPDPYSSSDPATLLDQMKTEWVANQAAAQRDVAQLFTGRDLDGTATGITFPGGVICDFQNGYSVVQSDFSPVFACVSDLTAHELGHAWSATHCVCPTTTMNPTIACANTFVGAGANSVAEIIAHRDTRPCIVGGAAPPPNNTCDGAEVFTANGTLSGANETATTDGAGFNCADLGAGTKDLYWRVTPPVSGILTVDTCLSTPIFFDTVLTVHTGCPATPANMVVCSDDCATPQTTCGTLISTKSCVSIPAVGGQDYYLRAAAFALANGTYAVRVNAPASPSADACGNAQPITAGQTIIGSLYGLTADGESECVSANGNPDAWYSFTATCPGTLVVSTCGTHDAGGVDRGMDTVISIHDGCPGTLGNQRACNDNALPPCAGDLGVAGDARASTTLAAGQTVRIRVSHATGGFGNGMFQLRAAFGLSTGDANCDGIRDLADVPAFILALTDPAGFEAAYPGCDIHRCDVNGDGAVNGRDIQPFVAGLQPPRGDLNCDGVRSLADVAAFILAVTDPTAYAATYPGCDIGRADVNGDGTADGRDVAALVTQVIGGGGCP